MEHLQAWGFFGLIVLTAAQNSTYSPAPQTSYVLLVSRFLRPGVPTSLSLTVLTDSSVTVSALIIHDNRVVVSHSATVDGGSTKLLTLPPIQDRNPNLRYPYMLEVKGHVGSREVFFNSTQLQFHGKASSNFIQTDKMNYRPGQRVRIRSVSVHLDGKPYDSPVDLVILDPRNNLVRQWLSLESFLGVVSKEFQLSDNPPLGEWKIVTTIAGVSTKQYFNVAHYMLPKFQVVIDAPDVIYHRDTLWGSITSQYMYGMPVQGRLNVTYLHQYRGIEEAYHEQYETDGTTDFMFDLPDHNFYTMSQSALDMDLMEYEDMDRDCLKIVAHVTDHLTGLTYNSTAKVYLAKSKYRLSFDGYPEIIRPSLKFAATLKISTYDNQPLSPEDQQKMVQVSVLQQKKSHWSWDMDMDMDMEREMFPLHANLSGPWGPRPEETMPEEMEFPVPADGRIPLNIQLLNDTATLTIDAYFDDSHEDLQLYSSYKSPSDSYLQILAPSAPPAVGSPLLLAVESNFPMSEVHYIVKSRGQVVSAGQSSGLLILFPEATWAPVACVIAYCVHPSGEIVNNVLRLHIAQTLNNKVSLSWSETRAKPSEDVSLKVQVSDPKSLVGILVVDKATKSQGSYNDITEMMVAMEMSNYDESKSDAYAGTMTMGDPYSVFQMCGLVALTDSSLYQMKPTEQPLFREEIFDIAETHGPNMEQHQEPRVRSFFPETWIWRDVNTSSYSSEIPLTVPDSITSWVATAFVMSEDLGLGIVEQPVELVVFQDFFMSVNLPAYVIRGEELLLEVILFNYLNQDLEVTVIVTESEAFEFVFMDNEEISMTNVREVSVGSRSGASVLIPIKPLVLGEMDVSVKAMSSVASDKVTKKVLIKAEGIEELFSISLLFELSSSQPSVSRELNTFSLPPNVVEGSERAVVTAVGDILGPSISGLESLIQMPYGCGEQNMINFAPNIYVLQYLSTVGQDDQETRDRAIDYMMKGYERELSYQRDDSSFSAFGDRDSSGSAWLTAFVLRCFLQARPFINIDAHVLRGAASWLGDIQEADGSFPEPGRVIHTELKGGQDGAASLTAYVLIALLEDGDIRARYSGQVAAALMYLETSVALGVSSNYSLSLITYALALAGSSSADVALSELIGRAEMRDGVPMWSSSERGVSASWQPLSADIEMAAYLLLAQHRLGHIAEAIGLMKWLSQQRNHRGGFGSTQDTVVALQALSVFASLMAFDYDLTITVSTGPSTTVASFHIHQDNHLLHQSQQIGADELNLQVSAKGRGLALFQLNVFYNIRNEDMRRRRREVHESEAFHLDVQLMDEDPDWAMLHICFSLSSALGLNATGMVIMEVGVLSGFSLDPDVDLTDYDMVKRVETEPGKVILYLDSVTTEEICRVIPLLLEYKVSKVQEAMVLIYDYYEPRRRTMRTYASEWRSNMSPCSYCGDDCSRCKPHGHYGNSMMSHGNRQCVTLTPARLLLFLLLVFITVVGA